MCKGREGEGNDGGWDARFFQREMIINIGLSD
jgi:hypothetical protein